MQDKEFEESLKEDQRKVYDMPVEQNKRSFRSNNYAADKKQSWQKKKGRSRHLKSWKPAFLFQKQKNLLVTLLFGFQRGTEQKGSSPQV